MTKRLLLSVGMLCCLVYASAFEWTMGKFDYEKRTCAIIGWEGFQPISKAVEIPGHYYLGETYFSVTEIAAGACDNLNQIETLTIGENIQQIGPYSNANVADIENFRNCPKLKTFKVSASNQRFAADSRGVLTDKEGKMIMRVPQMVQTETAGSFTIAPTILMVYPEAFAENSTIRSIRLSGGLYYISRPMGFNSMLNLEAFFETQTGNEYTVYGGCLYTRDMKTLVSFPPRKANASFSPSPLTVEVEPQALANTYSLREFDVKNIRKFGKDAFRGSGIAKLELPNEEIIFGEGMLRDCANLKSLTIYHSSSIPRDFARGSGLQRVSLLGSAKIGRSAFKDCASLTGFSFGPDIDLDRDSIFAGSGLVKVEYAAGAITGEDLPMGSATFASCPELTEIDMSGLVIPQGTNKVAVIGTLFAADCPKLEKVSFPRLVSFVGASGGNKPNFGYNSAVKTLILRAFYKTEYPAFIYTEGKHTPAVFLLTSDPQRPTWPMRTMFKTEGNNVSLRPQIFCESYNMRLENPHTYDYVSPNSSYYIPGMTRENYRQAENEGCTTLEMFRIDFQEVGGKVRVQAVPVLDFVNMTAVSVDNSDYTVFNDQGFAQTSSRMSSAREITVEYTVKGIPFKTIYPVSAFSGIDVAAGYELGETEIAIDGRTVRFGVMAEYAVADMSGKTISSGTGHCAELDDAPAGIYILSLRSEGCAPRSVKIALR